MKLKINGFGDAAGLAMGIIGTVVIAVSAVAGVVVWKLSAWAWALLS